MYRTTAAIYLISNVIAGGLSQNAGRHPTRPYTQPWPPSFSPAFIARYLYFPRGVPKAGSFARLRFQRRKKLGAYTENEYSSSMQPEQEYSEMAPREFATLKQKLENRGMPQKPHVYRPPYSSSSNSVAFSY
ncbi:hypothetical protein KIN20_008803 [Parelaphostrongylus tenuis]|uniref:Uncharacterized protein n=1 Tax=Parelaphostrongylus tenuis TaxID=148309 RepID=A0AAD5M5C1_PARTN|nr:hypothetical protein KIN20_008803 [Parelaphostrongylus tenuis]